MEEILTKDDVGHRFGNMQWQRVAFAEFESTLTSATRPFPCVFGVTGFKRNQLRFAFPDPLTPETMAPLLQRYLAEARGYGRMTSLVAFARPGPVQHIDEYRDRFWQLLDGLEAIDEGERPESVPRDLDNPLWEFCFAGEPIFVVCNSPAHVLRQSRRATSFMVTFQPRWVFEGIVGTDDPVARKAIETVRARLAAFDLIEPAPFLGEYGTPDNREYKQYFIDDTNAAPACPFSQLGRTEPLPQTRKGKVA